MWAKPRVRSKTRGSTGSRRPLRGPFEPPRGASRAGGLGVTTVPKGRGGRSVPRRASRDPPSAAVDARDVGGEGRTAGGGRQGAGVAGVGARASPRRGPAPVGSGAADFPGGAGGAWTWEERVNGKVDARLYGARILFENKKKSL